MFAFIGPYIICLPLLVPILEEKNMEEDEFNVDLPSEPTDADLDTIESGDDNWTWDQDAIVFDDEEVIH
jgi:hypothetical protein